MYDLIYKLVIVTQVALISGGFSRLLKKKQFNLILYYLF
jgi:hypothetical protein